MPEGLVSIHAPVRGATRPTDTGVPQRSVSIHAPVRGRRFRSMRAQPEPVIGFNPRPRAGGDLIDLLHITPGRHPFQSTPPCGGRHRSPNTVGPRHAAVSIHAPVRGATGITTERVHLS